MSKASKYRDDPDLTFLQFLEAVFTSTYFSTIE